MDVLFSNFINNFTRNSILEACGIIFWCLFLVLLTFIMSFIFFHLTKTIYKKFFSLNKEELLIYKNVPSNINFIYILFLTMVFVPYILIYALMPYSKGFIILNSQLSSLICLTALLLSFSSSIFLSLLEHSKERVNYIKNIFKAFIFFIPLNFSVLCSVIQSSSFNLNEIILSQVSGKILSNFYFINNITGFIVFILSSIFILKYINLNNQSFWNSCFNIFFTSSISILCIIFFFGGYLSPFDFYFTNLFVFNSNISTFFIFVEQFIWLLIKFIILLFILIKMYNKIKMYNISIKKAAFILSAIGILNFVVVSIIKYFSTGNI